MKLIHIFYRELPLNENNIFTASLAEKKEVEGHKNIVVHIYKYD